VVEYHGRQPVTAADRDATSLRESESLKTRPRHHRAASAEWALFVVRSAGVQGERAKPGSSAQGVSNQPATIWEPQW